MAASAAARVGFAEVAGIAVDGEDHVACGVCDDGFLLCRDVVEKLFCLAHCVHCRVCLLCCNGAECCEDCGVDGSAEV